jgi:glucose-6-phosphate 1-epimerase
MNPDLRAYELPGIATFFDGPGGLTVLDVKTAGTSARMFLHGAQLTHWQPDGAQPVIFLSRESLFSEGKAIRGGVPVCFPWFGPREGQAAHGFVRNKNWQIEEVRPLGDGSVRAVFVTKSDEMTRTRWPHDYVTRLAYTIGLTLVMDLEVENASSEPFEFSEALHTYFVVGDAERAVVTGLEDTRYRDFPDRSKLTMQEGPIRFTEEIDRVYVNTRATCVLHDPGMRRRIVVAKAGSDTTTVWNPWTAKAAALADFGDDEWKSMVCIETVNAAENSVTLAPGAKHTMSARIHVEPL